LLFWKSRTSFTKSYFSGTLLSSTIWNHQKSKRYFHFIKKKRTVLLTKSKFRQKCNRICTNTFYQFHFIK
jgi:hypothetical protein